MVFPRVLFATAELSFHCDGLLVSWNRVCVIEYYFVLRTDRAVCMYVCMCVSATLLSGPVFLSAAD